MERYVAWLAVALAACGSSELVPVPPDEVDSVVLHIDLQDGWAGEVATVLVNSEAVFTGSVSTRPQLSLAEQIETDVPVGPVSIRVEVADSDLAANFDLELEAEWWVGLSLVDGELSFQSQRTLFGYL